MNLISFIFTVLLISQNDQALTDDALPVPDSSGMPTTNEGQPFQDPFADVPPVTDESLAPNTPQNPVQDTQVPSQTSAPAYQAPSYQPNQQNPQYQQGNPETPQQVPQYQQAPQAVPQYQQTPQYQQAVPQYQQGEQQGIPGQIQNPSQGQTYPQGQPSQQTQPYQAQPYQTQPYRQVPPAQAQPTYPQQQRIPSQPAPAYQQFGEPPPSSGLPPSQMPASGLPPSAPNDGWPSPSAMPLATPKPNFRFPDQEEISGPMSQEVYRRQKFERGTRPGSLAATGLIGFAMNVNRRPQQFHLEGRAHYRLTNLVELGGVISYRFNKDHLLGFLILGESFMKLLRTSKTRIDLHYGAGIGWTLRAANNSSFNEGRLTLRAQTDGLFYITPQFALDAGLILEGFMMSLKSGTTRNFLNSKGPPTQLIFTLGGRFEF